MNLSFTRTSTTLLAAFFALVGGYHNDVSAGRPVYIGSKDHTSASIDSVNHSDWDRMLRTYVDTNGMVAYSQWKANSSDVQALDRYIATLSAVDDRQPSSREGKMAFWINAYNAVTIRGILREFPTSSIRNHTAKAFGYNIWKDLQLYVGGRPHSLEGIEHEILRPMKDARVHFAIVCASIGCPRLLNEAYIPQRLNEQLEINSKDFFARPQNFRHTAASKFQLSSIMDWYGSDFGSNQSAVLQNIAKWLPTDAARQTAAAGNASVSYLKYDWGLNGK